jgi:tRNA(fMet)-specific endonuclease VapC
MILLDTDHLSVFTDERDPRHSLLNQRMEAAAEEVASTIVNVEEMLRGWLAIIHGLRDAHRQVPAYVRLGKLFDVLNDWEIVPFDEGAANQVRGPAAAAYPHRHHGPQHCVHRPGERCAACLG